MQSKKTKICNPQSAIRNHDGVAALLTVIVVSAAVLIMAVTASILGLGELEMGFDSQKGAESFSIADGCVEEALRHLRIDANYSGETLNLGDGSCIISIIPSGSNRTISATANVGSEYYKNLEVSVTLSGDDSNHVIVNSWEEK